MELKWQPEEALAGKATMTSPIINEESRLYGERGWTQGRVKELILSGARVRPFCVGSDDYLPFFDMEADTAFELALAVPKSQFADRQNFSPTFLQMVTAAGAHPDQVRLDGYMIGPERPDERVTIEALTWNLSPSDPPVKPHVSPWEWLKEELFGDEEVSPPDEIAPVCGHNGLGGWWLWWD